MYDVGMGTQDGCWPVCLCCSEEETYEYLVIGLRCEKGNTVYAEAGYVLCQVAERTRTGFRSCDGTPMDLARDSADLRS